MKKISTTTAHHYIRITLKTILVLMVSMHVVSILLHASFNAYHSYHSFYDLKPAKFVKDFNDKVSSSKAYQYYGKITGTECGYGFFAPNVRSGGALLIEGCGEQTTPTFKSHEGRLRYEGFIGDMINDITQTEKQQADTTLVAKKDSYNKLILKNISTFVMKQSEKPCNFCQVSYCLVDFPDLATAKTQKTNEMSVVPLRSFFIFPN